MLKLKNKYFILRHGQTIYQTRKKKFIYPWLENPPILLTKEGREQIKAAAQKLKNEKIDLIYSSDFPRTAQTAEITARELGLKINPARKQGFLNGVNFDERLREINLGIYCGKTKESYLRFLQSSKEKFYQKPKGGESWPEVKKRIVSFLKEIDKRHRNKNILVISHGDPLWLFFGAVKGLTNKELLKNKENIFLETGEFKKL